MIDGHGDPNTARAYAEAVEVLYTVAYTVRFALKRGRQDVDAQVMPLEGQWWTPDMAKFSVEDKAGWDWTLMIAAASAGDGGRHRRGMRRGGEEEEARGERTGAAGALRGRSRRLRSCT